MHIAIVVPAFDIAPFLGAALRSVLAQTHTDWSLVVVDDGSTDGTAVVASGFTDSRIRLIRQDNAGVSAARNRGIAAFLAPMQTCSIQSSWYCRIDPPGAVPSRAEAPEPPKRGDHPSQPSPVVTLGVAPDAFLFLDGDDWLTPNALARLVESLESAPWAVAARGPYVRASGNDAARPGLIRSPPKAAIPIMAFGGANAFARHNVGRGRRFAKISTAAPKGCLLETLLTRNLFANGGHLLIRREAIETAGLFRQDLSYGEDWEYWTRVALLGEFVAVPSCAPLLFVRERPGGAYLSNGFNPLAYRPALDAIYANPAVADRLGVARVACLRHAAEAEIAWAVGRELIRHGNWRLGRVWLRRSVWQAPSFRRLLLLGLAVMGLALPGFAWLRFGPFRPYRTAE